MTLTRRQSEILEFLRTHIDDHGYAPSFEEIAERFGFASLATVHEHLTNLERKGYITRQYNESRSIQVSPPRGTAPATEVPLLGKVAAGMPIESLMHDETIAVPEEMLPRRGPNYALKVQGDSMEPDIPNGSYCLFRKPRAGSRDGRKLLVWHSGITDPHTGGQYTLKVYTSEKTASDEADWQHTRIVLKPLNRDYDPITLTPEDEGDVRVIAELVEVVSGI